MSGGTPSEFWPIWLAEDIERLGVWTIEYDSSPTLWRGHSMTRVDRANTVAVMAPVMARDTALVMAATMARVTAPVMAVMAVAMPAVTAVVMAAVTRQVCRRLLG